MESPLTPMMQQFFTLKEQNPEFILFFRLGDFYEMFDEDAKISSKILGLTLTKRQQFDMCGIPYHAKDNYLHKLIEAQYKVALCEQIEVVVNGKKFFERAITERLTPGTFHGDKNPLKNNNSFLMSLYFHHNTYFFSLSDINTGELYLGQSKDKEHILAQIHHSSPSEILLPTSQKEELSSFTTNAYHSFVKDAWFTKPDENFLKSQFHTKSLSSLSLEHLASQGVVFAILQYLRQNLFKEITHLNTLEKISFDSHLWMSDTTIQNLDLLPKDKESGKYTLYGHLNHTQTNIGARYLRRLLTAPSLSKKEIENRLGKIENLLKENSHLELLRKKLSLLPDFPRLMAKIALKTANPRDLWSLKLGVEAVLDIKKELPLFLSQDLPEPLITSLQKLSHLLTHSLVPEPPINIEGEAVFKEEYSDSLAELRKNSTQSYQIILDIEEREKTQNNLPRLRIKYNKVLGYYIELPKMEAQKAPSYFIRKQTLSNLERFTVQELLDFESLILSSKAKLILLEKELFKEFLDKIMDWLLDIQKLGEGIGEIDIVSTFTHLAYYHSYVKPKILEEGALFIKDGRHPVVEKTTPIFTPNSLNLNDDDSRLWIISGPNMAGKSTFLRQSAIIVLMAHMGCFVPAIEALIPLTDQIFTRIGSSDNLAKGESTFLVEMAEAASILRFATARSLIIMDELGRGTSTNDGLSLCFSIVEYLCDPKVLRGRVLFSTHYHELASLEEKLKGVKNYQMSVEETKNDIVFLHKIEHGAAQSSYGIHVASLAGIPPSVIKRAKIILHSLPGSTPLPKQLSYPDSIPTQEYKPAISNGISENLTKSLNGLNLDKTTGIQALLFLSTWQKKLQKERIHKPSDDDILF